MSPVSSTLSLHTGEIFICCSEAGTEPCAASFQEGFVCSWLFTSGFPSVLSPVQAPCLGSLFSYPLISKLVMEWFGCSVSDTRARSTSPTRLTSICAGRTSLCRLTAAVRKETLASAVADAFFHPSTCWGGLVSPVWGHHSTEVLWLLSW